jgi:hypothetical protein
MDNLNRKVRGGPLFMEILSWKVRRGPGSWISYNQGGHERAWVMDLSAREARRGPGSWIT